MFCLLIWKYIKVKRALSRMKRAKLNAYRQSIGLPPVYPWYESLFRCIFGGLGRIFLRISCWCLLIKRKSSGKTIWELIWTTGTLENSVAVSTIGFISGLIFTHSATTFLIFQLNFDATKTTYSCLFLGLFITFSLAFSSTARLFAFLILPQFFTKKGRGAILAYCLILALSGPGKNTTRNMEILTTSLICTQEMAHNATQGLIDLVKDPMSALGSAMKNMVQAVKESASSIMKSVKALINIVLSIVNTIKFAYEWLKNLVNFCNDKVGTPYSKCLKAFDEAQDDCKVKLGSTLSWMCSVVETTQNLCQVAKAADIICWFPSLVKKHVFEPIKKSFKKMTAGIKTFFDVRIRFNYTLEHSFTSSKSFDEIVSGMKSEVLEEAEWMFKYLDWVNLLSSLFMLLALYKAIVYRHRYLNIDSHDNWFITKGLVDIDMRRRRLGHTTIFPLKYRESFTYVDTFSLVLVKSERKAMSTQISFVTLGAVQVMSYVAIDYSFYHFLLLIKKHGALHIDTRKILGYNVKIEGDGFMADLYRAVLHALSPIGTLLPVFDTSPCLPVPSVPNYYRYAMIFFLLFICYAACITEPYGMRLRHIICGIYYPERSVARDRWLYTHILSSRDNFFSFAIGKIRAMGKRGGDFRVGFLDRLSHTIPLLRKIFYFFRVKKKNCFLCGKSGDIDDRENFIECPKCSSVYCAECYEEIGGECIACETNIQIGEISEEEGSDSDDSFEDEKAQKKTIIAKTSNKYDEKVPLLSKSEYSDDESTSENDYDIINIESDSTKNINKREDKIVDSSSSGSITPKSSFEIISEQSKTKTKRPTNFDYNQDSNAIFSKNNYEHIGTKITDDLNHSPSSTSSSSSSSEIVKSANFSVRKKIKTPVSNDLKVTNLSKKAVSLNNENFTHEIDFPPSSKVIKKLESSDESSEFDELNPSSSSDPSKNSDDLNHSHIKTSEKSIPKLKSSLKSSADARDLKLQSKLSNRDFKNSSDHPRESFKRGLKFSPIKASQRPKLTKSFHNENEPSQNIEKENSKIESPKREAIKHPNFKIKSQKLENSSSSDTEDSNSQTQQPIKIYSPQKSSQANLKFSANNGKQSSKKSIENESGHYTEIDDEVFEKYDEVISELSATIDENSAKFDLSSSDDFDLSENNENSHFDSDESEGDLKESELTEMSSEDEKFVQKFRKIKKVSPALRERVEMLEDFFEKTPHRFPYNY